MDHIPLMWNAVINENTHLLNQLLERGCSPDSILQEATRSPALILAIVHGKSDAVRLLIHYQASLNFKDNQGKTPIMLSCVYNRSDILSLLLDKGADVTSRDDDGKTALHYAALHGQVECLQILMNHPSINLNQLDAKEEKSAVSFAVSGKDSVQCLRLLVNCTSVDINGVDKNGNTPLISAIHLRKVNHAQILLDKGAEVNVKNVKDKTALTKAFEQTTNREMLQIIDKLLSCGARPDFSLFDENFIHDMIARCQPQIVQQMIINGCTPQLRVCRENVFQFDISEKISPLAVALLSNQLGMAKYLLANSFLTPFDINNLPNNHAIESYLRKKGFTHCLALLADMSSSPLPLLTLSLTTISNAIAKKYSRDLLLSQLPKRLQDKILFKTNIASLCIQEWETIPLMIESGHNFRVLRPILEVWPIGHKLMECPFRCCAMRKGYKLLRINP